MLLLLLLVPTERAMRPKARCGRDPAEMIPRRQNPKSMTVSVILLIVIFALIIGFIIAVSVFVGRPTPPTQPPPVPSPRIAAPPEVTSSSTCHVVGNGTRRCFRFASNFTTRWCAAVDGVIININSSTSSIASTTRAAAAAAATVCYHNICLDFIVDDRFCFLNRSHPIYSYTNNYCIGLACNHNVSYYARTICNVGPKL